MASRLSPLAWVKSQAALLYLSNDFTLRKRLLHHFYQAPFLYACCWAMFCSASACFPTLIGGIGCGRSSINLSQERRKFKQVGGGGVANLKSVQCWPLLFTTCIVCLLFGYSYLNCYYYYYYYNYYFITSCITINICITISVIINTFLKCELFHHWYCKYGA